jgi:hypothetical protein
VTPETAGDPMSQKKWTRSSLRTLAGEMKEAGYRLCHVTVGAILKCQGYSLRVNHKRGEGPPHPDRNLQFNYIHSQRQAFTEARLPVISVDTKWTPRRKSG